MSISKSFGVDKKQSQEGKWFEVDYDDNNKAVRFKLSYMSSQNKKMNKISTAVMKPYKRQIENGSLPEPISEKIAIEIFVRSVLLDWDNVIVNEGDGPLEFNEENATQLMKEFPTLFQYLLLMAKDFANFKQEENEELAKNS